MSSGLTKEDEADLIVFAGTYNIPSQMPKNPMDTELHRGFPVAFSSFRLRSGKRAITRTRYVGKCYDNPQDWTNFFVHGLILPESDWEFHPIELCWDDELILPPETNPVSRIWFDGLKFKDEQNIGRIPPPLPTMEIREEHIKHFTDYDFDRLFDIKKQFGNSDRFEKWFKSLFVVIQNRSKKILLRDTPQNIAAWIAAVQYALPVTVSQNITFTTYCNSDTVAQKFDIAGISLDGSTLSINSSNYIGFDFAAGTVPQQKTDTPYLQIINTANFPGNEVAICKEFSEETCVPFSFDTLDEIVSLKYLIKGEIAPDDTVAFDVAWNAYTRIADGKVSSQLGEEILKHYENEPLPIALLQKIVLHFEKLTDTAFPESTIKKNFTNWFTQQFCINWQGHNQKMVTLLNGLSHKGDYAKPLLEKFGTDIRILNLFLPLFVSADKRTLDESFVKYVIQQFTLPIKKAGTQQSIIYEDVRNLFKSANWILFFQQFLDTVEKNPQIAYLPFYFTVLFTAYDDGKAPSMKRRLDTIRSFVKGLHQDTPEYTIRTQDVSSVTLSDESQEIFYNKVLLDTFSIASPIQQSLLFDCFVTGMENDLPSQFATNFIPKIVSTLPIGILKYISSQKEAAIQVANMLAKQSVAPPVTSK
ncbi:hypothetical protein FACS189427_06140 [Planctomycetales bacterium]|nr:hypothetical protein FACS189427_06140 [Planctomycetales bacterium]